MNYILDGTVLLLNFYDICGYAGECACSQKTHDKVFVGKVK